jgi:hypothetical protein
MDNVIYCFILDPPTVQVQQPSYSVTTGNTVTLVCTVTSTLQINNVQWQRNVGGTITTITSTSCNTECCGGTLSCSNAVGGETCVSSYITGCSIEDGQRRCGGSTTTVFVGVGIGSDGCYGTTNISLPLYIIYL